MIETLIGLAGMVTIEIDSCREGIRGHYNGEKIVVCESIDKSEYKKVLLHELGHTYWHKKMSEKNKEKFEKIHKNAESFVSEYAKTTVEEDFAESFESVYMYKSLPESGKEIMKGFRKRKQKEFIENMLK